MSNLAAEKSGHARLWRAHLMALLGVVAVLVLTLVGISKSVEDVRTVQSEHSDTVGELLSSNTVGQTFVAEYDGLSSVEVLLATYARGNSGLLIFHLRSSLDATDLVTFTFDAANVRDNAYYVFEFPPLPDSAGRAFYFQLEASEAEPGNAITVWGTSEDVYPEGMAVLQGLDSGICDLAFRLRYDLPLRDGIHVLLDRLTAGKPSLLGDKWLYVLLGGTYLSLIYVQILQSVRADWSAGNEET